VTYTEPGVIHDEFAYKSKGGSKELSEAEAVKGGREGPGAIARDGTSGKVREKTRDHFFTQLFVTIGCQREEGRRCDEGGDVSWDIIRDQMVEHTFFMVA